jgi:hypothetical protein
MKRLKLALVALIGLILVIIIAGLLVPKGTNISGVYSISTGLGSAEPYGNNSLVFANNRSFVSYNYVTGKATSLGSDNLQDNDLSSVSSIYTTANLNYILFYASVPSGGTLYNLLSAYGYGTSSAQGSWWVYSVNSQKYQPLPPDVILAEISGNNIYALSNSSSGEAITTYSPSSLSQTNSINVSGVSNFFATKNGYLLEDTNNDVSYTKNGTVTQSINKSSLVTGVSSNEQQAILIENSNTLVELNLNNFSTSTISSDVVDQPIWSSASNSAMYFGGSNKDSSSSWKLNTYSLPTKKKTTWIFTKPNANFASGITLNTVLGSTSAIVSQGKGNYYLVGNRLKAISTPGNNYNKSLTVDGSPVTISYSSISSSVVVEAQTYNQDTQTAVYAQLEKDGFNPYLLNIILATS